MRRMNFKKLEGVRFNKPVVPSITTAWLERKMACSGQVELFKKTFPDTCDTGVTPTVKNIMKAARAGLSIYWLSHKGVLTPEQNQAFTTLDYRADNAMYKAQGYDWRHDFGPERKEAYGYQLIYALCH